jgi:hypothetical protein
MIRLTQTRMKIHHASFIRPIKNKLFTDENYKYTGGQSLCRFLGPRFPAPLLNLIPALISHALPLTA